MCSHVFRNFEAVVTGHGQVEEHQVGPRPQQGRHNLGSIRGLADFVGTVVVELGQSEASVGTFVDDQTLSMVAAGLRWAPTQTVIACANRYR